MERRLMWLSTCRQWISRQPHQALQPISLWSISSGRFVVLCLGSSVCFLLLVFSLTGGWRYWEGQQHQSLRYQESARYRQLSERVRTELGQGNWLGIPVMPALAASWPMPGTNEQLADLQYLNRLLKLYPASAVQIHPYTVPGDKTALAADTWSEVVSVPTRLPERLQAESSGSAQPSGMSQSIWRGYELRLKTEAITWLALLAQLSSQPGVELQQQEWSQIGNGVIRLRMLGVLPVLVVGQVADDDGPDHLVLKDGQLLRGQQMESNKGDYVR